MKSKEEEEEEEEEEEKKKKKKKNKKNKYKVEKEVTNCRFLSPFGLGRVSRVSYREGCERGSRYEIAIHRFIGSELR
jgi:hypothetical protein